MRTFPDRIRHTLLFEIIAIVFATIAGSLIVDRPLEEMGLLSVLFSLLAMSWNLIYNWLFDLWDLKFREAAKRTLLLRISHAILFEAGILIAGMFLISWWLEMTLWQALLLDIGFAVFFVIYALIYNWAYDVVFPIAKAV